jgi:Lon protease-like protein
MRDLPIFPLELVLVPDEPLPLHIFEPRYREMTARCVDQGEPFVLVLADEQGIREIGCTAEITDILERFADGRSNIAVRGGEPVRLVEIHDEHAYRSAHAEALVDEPAEAPLDAQEAALTAFRDLAAELDGRAPEAPDTGPGLSYRLLGRIEVGHDVKQSLLEDRDERRRLEIVHELLTEVHRGLVLTRETQERARRNGRVRTPEELAAELGLDG